MLKTSRTLALLHGMKSWSNSVIGVQPKDISSPLDELLRDHIHRDVRMAYDNMCPMSNSSETPGPPFIGSTDPRHMRSNHKIESIFLRFMN